MSDYFVVLSNISSIISIIYFIKKCEYYYSMQIFLTSSFSLVHHINQSDIYHINDNKFTDLLDGTYSYWLVYIFTIYLFLSNHKEQEITRSFMFTLILGLGYFNFGIIVMFPIIATISIVIILYNISNINKLIFLNKYLFILFLACACELTIYIIGSNDDINYNYYHSFHHIIAYNIPILIDRYLISCKPIIELNV